ncbi:MAG: DUF2752 domain-containing protein [Bacteroidaceae bacterium]|nr:DUF2752 domain-containing protein [Bacteroidaceae bacterium]
MLPCPFHVLTGLDCPMCGGQRMVVALIDGHVAEAFWLNPFLFVGAPALALWCWWADGLSARAALVVLVLMVAWGVVRNVVPLLL